MTRKEADQRYREKHREELRAKSRERYHADLEKNRAYHREWQKRRLETDRERRRAYLRKHYQLHPRTEYLRQWREANSEAYYKSARKYAIANPEKIRAYQTVNRAMKNGTMTRQPCHSCSKGGVTHAHHPDYAKPLDVIWLCARCHKQQHPQLKVNQN